MAAFGVGTKFMRHADIAADGSGQCVHDSHAEVLARRAFLRFLYGCILRLTSTAPPPCQVPNMLERSPADSFTFRVKPGVSLHLYTSAVPCGNAVIKRWAQGVQEPTYADLPASELPDISHPPILLHAQHLSLIHI